MVAWFPTRMALAFFMVWPLIGIIELAAPTLAWGAIACAVPVLVHLLLRPRPRRQMLPTLRFLLQVQQSANRMHRLKRFLLLACRMLLVLLLVLLLMRPSYRAASANAAAGPRRPAPGPVSAVF